MGPNYWKNRSTELKKCSEFSLGKSCPEPVFDDCCKIVACSYCIELDLYGESLQAGVAEFALTKYTGVVAGFSFELFVRRNEYTDICEAVVLLDGEEVYVRSCEDGMSCRDLSDEIDIVIDYDSGVLRWDKVEPLPLPHIEHPDTGCKTWFCGECECTSECLCIKITEPNGDQFSGEICNINYECGPPNWEGRIGSYDLAITLDRGEDGECLIVSSIDGEEQTPIVITECNNISISIELYDGTIINISSKICACEEEPLELCCGDRREAPEVLYLEAGRCLFGRLAGVDCEVSDYESGANASGVLTAFSRDLEGRSASYHGVITITRQALVEMDGTCSLVEVSEEINICLECSLGVGEGADAFEMRWSSVLLDDGKYCFNGGGSGPDGANAGLTINVVSDCESPLIPNCPTFPDESSANPVWADPQPAWTSEFGGIYQIACCDPLLFYVFVEDTAIPNWPFRGGWMLITE